jgi:integrase
MAYIEERNTGDGQTRYRVLIRLKGHPVQSATFERKTDAKRWASDTESAIREGRHFKSSEAKKHTLEGLIDRYTRDVLPNKPKSKDKQEQQLEWWKDQIGSYLLSDVTPALIAEYRDKLAAEKTKRADRRSPATVIRYLAALSHAFTIAVKEWGWLEANPVLKVTKPKEPRGRVRFLSDDVINNGTVIDGERTRLLKACTASPCKHLYPVVILALSTGMRLNEIMTLTWDSVDLQRRRITLHETKNGERRVVPLVSKALDILREHAKVRRLDTNLVFPSNKTKKPLDLRAPWEAALKAAKIEDFRFHDLRHTAASYLAMNGASVAEIAEVLGHKTLQMVKRYSHLSEPHTAGVVERMNTKLFG